MVETQLAIVDILKFKLGSETWGSKTKETSGIEVEG